MQTITRRLIDAGLGSRVLTGAQLALLIESSNQSRYNLVNRAMKTGELIRLRRGLYRLADKYRNKPCHPYALAHHLVPGSYVSFETALSFHGWIPETVYTTASVLPGRKTKQFHLERMGLFSFHPLATQTGFFLELVDRLKLDEQILLLASPIRALMDLVCLKKSEWRGLSSIEEGMRIDREFLSSVTEDELQILKIIYKHQRVLHYIDSLGEALGLNLAEKSPEGE